MPDAGRTYTLNAIDENPELFIIRRQQAALMKKRIAAIKSNPMAFYRPHTKQDAFHQAGIRFKRRMVRAGNRFGKSEMGCKEDMAWNFGERAWYPADHPARRGGIPQHPVKGLLITTDWDKVDEIWTTERGDSPGKVWRSMPDGGLKSKKRNSIGCIDTIEFSSGSIMKFDTVKSFMSNPMGSESSDWDYIHVDEPCPEQMFKAAARGLIDRGGSAWFTLTPLSEYWINDYFFPADTGGKARDDVWAIDGSIYDNPYLPPDAIEEFIRLLTDDEKQCRVFGIPLHLTGLVYKEFSWDKHVLKDVPKGWASWTNPPANYTIYYAIDTHPRTAHAVLFLAVSPLGAMFVYNEIFEHTDIPGLTGLIRPVIDGRWTMTGQVEPGAWIEDQNDDSSLATQLMEGGLNIEKAVKDPKRGILKAKEVLKADPQTIYFSPVCRRTLWEIQRYAWDEKHVDKPMDKDDHMMEDLYRLLIKEPRWIDMTPSANPVDEQVIDRPEIEAADLVFDLD